MTHPHGRRVKSFVRSPRCGRLRRIFMFGLKFVSTVEKWQIRAADEYLGYATRTHMHRKARLARYVLRWGNTEMVVGRVRSRVSGVSLHEDSVADVRVTRRSALLCHVIYFFSPHGKCIRLKTFRQSCLPETNRNPCGTFLINSPSFVQSFWPSTWVHSITPATQKSPQAHLP